MYDLAGFGEAEGTIISWAMQPARMAQIRRDPASEVVSVCPRRDPPPLRFGAALSCVVSRLEMGRHDVGLAKSVFAPPGPGVLSPFRRIRPFAHSPTRGYTTPHGRRLSVH